MKDFLDRFAGKVYNRLLSVALGVVALVAIVIGSGIVSAGNMLFGSVWLGGGILFGFVAQRLWRSRSSLRETFDGHG
jgi:hypothetical protein